MAKPDWLVERELDDLRLRRYKRCVSCEHAGEVCGQTNNRGGGKGRGAMYRCKLHPTVQFHEGSYACTDHKLRNPTSMI